MLLTLLLTGCAQLDDLKEGVAGLTNPIVLEGVFLGVAPPDSDLIDLAGTPFEEDAAAQVFLADAASVDDLDNAPVEGAAVSMLADASGRVDFHGEPGGSYTATSVDGLVYDEGGQATLSATFDGDTSSVGMQLAAAPVLDIPEHMNAGTGFVVDLSGQGFDDVLVVVVNLQTGQVTFDNRPADIQGLYELSHGEGDVSVAVPASAIGKESVYAVGVAGLKNADTSGIENANTLLSAFIAGRFHFVPVSTIPN